jgi:DNA polymerase I-like protein with 3'-5' exonuclease and polymerase domains
MSFTYEDTEPIEIPPTIPKTLAATRKVDGVRMLAGLGVKPAKIMFLATTVLEEEERDYQKLSSFDEAIKSPPEYLKGLTGSILRNTTESLGIPVDLNYYTAWIKWLAPRAMRLRPNKGMMDAGRALVMDEIKEVDPDIIVCFGKPVFDELSDTKFRLSDIIGGWFPQEVHGRRRLLYPVDCVTKLATRPDRHNQFQQDMAEVARMVKRRAGVYTATYETNYQTIDTAAKLETLVDFLEEHNHNLLSVDCEWHGINHKVGQLRSLQICWSPGQAAYIRFMDDKLNYALDVSYKKAGEILGRHLNKPQVKYIGHHISADFPWMFSWLGLDWYGKALLDTEFALQCVDEASDLGLERLAMAFTDRGRYDLPLLLWKKKNGPLCKGGYGYIPDEILIPYGCADTDVVMQAYPHIERLLKQDHEDGRSHEYYHNIFNPFVTDIFTSFCINGLPIDMDRINLLRDLYHYARTELYVEFLRRVARESEQLLMAELLKADMESAEENMQKIMDLCGGEEYVEAEKFFYGVIPPANHMDVRCIWKYFLKAPTLNPGTADDMRLLLFDVKKFTPVKTTNQKDKGMPSMPWEKVLELPEAKQKLYSPSADKQTVEILANHYEDTTLHKLLEFKAVSTMCSRFGEPEIDEDTGEIVEEHGLHAFIDDGKIFGNFSSTETGRPRSWKPNLLNLPGFVNKKINSGMADILSLRREEGNLPKYFWGFEEDPKSIPSVRSIVTAPEGWCIVESDYATAELRGWAFIAGDEKMIELIINPDPNFAKVKPEKRVDDDCVCRLSFPEHLLNGSQEGEYDKYLMTYTVDNEIKATFADDDLLRDVEGNIVHSKQDLHWGLAEQYQLKPREVLNKKGLRGAAKTVNFSSAYGASGNTLERKIEGDTGVKPTEGMGDELLATLEARQPRAFECMYELEKKPEDPGYIVAASGRTRHFHLHDRNKTDWWTYKSHTSSQGREARNFLMQESVAATAARAATWLYRFKHITGLQGRPIAVLYDSVVTVCPCEERRIWKKAHELFMHLANGWEYHDRILRYPVDHELNQSWSSKPTKEQSNYIDSFDYLDTPEGIEAEKWLDKYVEFFTKNEEASVYGIDWALKQLEQKQEQQGKL